MKIALLGASKSGKTSYLSALYYRFRNVITRPSMSPKKAEEYARFGVQTQVGFRFKLSDMEMERVLAKNAQMLASKPILEWPTATSFLNKVQLNVTYDFVPVGTSSPQLLSDAMPRSYERPVQLLDPTGGSLIGLNERSESINRELSTCDVAIVFLPADVLLDFQFVDVDDDDEFALLSSNVSLGPILKIVEAIAGRLESGDIFPICFAISKSDKFYSSDIPDHKLVEFIEKLVYEKIIIPLSSEYPKFMICGCSISVVDPETGNFKGKNLEWPFLFSCFGTIFRNSLFLSRDAESNEALASIHDGEAQKLRNSHWWDRLTRFVMEGDTVGGFERRAATYRTKHRGLITMASDDNKLATDLWKSIMIEGREQRGMRVLRSGIDVIDPDQALR